MQKYVFKKGERFFFRRRIPGKIIEFDKFSKNSCFNPLLFSLRTSISANAEQKARFLELFTDFVFDRIATAMTAQLITEREFTVRDLREVMRTACEFWLDSQEERRAGFGTFSREDLYYRRQQTKALVAQVEDALAENNCEIVGAIIADGLRLLGINLDEKPEIEAVAGRAALIEFHEAATRDAEREEGIYREHDRGTKVVSISSGMAVKTPISAPAPIIHSSLPVQTTFVASAQKNSASNTSKESAATETAAQKPVPQLFPTSINEKEFDMLNIFKTLKANNLTIRNATKRDGGDEVTDPKYLRDFDRAVNRFTELCGNKPLTSYTNDDFFEYVETLKRLPVMNGKHGRNGSENDEKIDQRTLQDEIDWADQKDAELIVELTEDLREGRITESQKELIWEKRRVKRLSTTTINKDLTCLAKPFEFGRRELRRRYNIELADHIKPNRLPKKRKDQSWRQLTDSDLFKLLSQDIFTLPNGAPNGPRLQGIGPQKTFGYWSVLIALYSGLRLEEIGQLRPADFMCVSGIDYIQVRETDVQRVKSGAGVRKVVIHSNLIKLGLLDYVEYARKKSGSKGWLFDELERDGYNRRTGNFSKNYGNWRERIGLGEKGDGLDFHALRTTFGTWLINAGVSKEMTAFIMGHYQSGETMENYAKNVSLAKMKEAVESLDYGFDVVDVPETKVLRKRKGALELFPAAE